MGRLTIYQYSGCLIEGAQSSVIVTGIPVCVMELSRNVIYLVFVFTVTTFPYEHRSPLMINNAYI